MKIGDVYILEEAVDDLNEGRSFYDFQETGVGDYFWDCLIADIESLIIYADEGVKSPISSYFEKQRANRRFDPFFF